ncbi:hypothetical protein [Flaviaesturariibacter amylovorans]|uniref:Uncharacterized protein n=1 Tax=Flaviaesturariibacter amylovorans TaxID=1084520 RepID=A0ABP8HUC8_9BACT
MPDTDFDDQFGLLAQSLVAIAFEYVNFNEDELDAIYVFGSPTNDNCFNNFFYKINGEIVSGRRLNTVLKEPVDLSTERATAFFAQAALQLAAVAALFKKQKEEVPRIIRLVYNAREEALGLQLDHKLPSGYHGKEGDMAGIFMDWLDAVKEDEAAALAPF